MSKIDARAIVDLARGDDPPGEADAKVERVAGLIIGMAETAELVTNTAEARAWLDTIKEIVIALRW